MKSLGGTYLTSRLYFMSLIAWLGYVIKSQFEVIFGAITFDRNKQKEKL